MAKTIRKTSKEPIKLPYILLEMFLVTILIISTYLYFDINNKIKKENKSLDNLKNTYEENINILKEKEKSLNELNQQIEKYNDLDKEIENTKNEFFNTVKQLEQDIKDGKSNKKIAYMTFDDGPYFNTYKVLDILDRYDVKATFFTTNVNGKVYYEETDTYNYDLFKEYIKRGHTIANHTYTHAIFKGLYDSVDTFMDSLMRQHEHIKEEANGYETKIVRFPGGSGTAGNLKYPIIEALREKGYGWVDWNAYDGDGWDLRTQSEAWGYLKKSLDENIEVILFHDYCKITTDLLPEFIEYMQDKGYILLPLFYDSVMINK